MPVLTDEEWIAAWNASGRSPSAMSKAVGITERSIYARRRKLEGVASTALPTAGDGPANDYLQRIEISNFTGVAIVSSDHHYWPRQGASVAHRALVEVTKELKPNLNILNGDVFDGAKLSRFPRNGWEYQPKVPDELEEAKARTDEIHHACRRSRKLRTIGNHCIRFDRHLAAHAGDVDGIAGARLKDHLPVWDECVSVFINGHTMVKHRFHGGIHAAYNNTLRSGTSIVTGHTHHLEVKPWGDYRGRRYGVQTGAIADVAGPQFGYTEDNPSAWCSGFAVLTFDKAGRLLYPELCEIIEGTAYFRGQVVVSDRKRAA